jgi:hypothetical protein
MTKISITNLGDQGANNITVQDSHTPGALYNLAPLPDVSAFSGVGTLELNIHTNSVTIKEFEAPESAEVSDAVSPIKIKNTTPEGGNSVLVGDHELAPGDEIDVSSDEFGEDGLIITEIAGERSGEAYENKERAEDNSGDELTQE